jgi:sec-independent protein translocase protein TatA
MSMPGGMEWILIILVVVLLFGARKIPELARGLGQGIREFKKATQEGEKELDAPKDAQGKSEQKG